MSEQPGSEFELNINHLKPEDLELKAFFLERCPTGAVSTWQCRTRPYLMNGEPCAVATGHEDIKAYLEELFPKPPPPAPASQEEPVLIATG